MSLGNPALDRLWTWAVEGSGTACCGESASCYDAFAQRIEREAGLDPWDPEVARRRTGAVNAAWYEQQAKYAKEES